MPKPFVTTAVVKSGKIQVRNRPLLEKWAQLERDGDYTVTFERKHATRSLEQNALYHVGFVAPLAAEFGWTERDMHEYLKTRFMPPHKRKVKTLSLVNRRTGEEIDSMFLDLSSTTQLNKVEFSEYLRDIQVWAAEHGVDVGSNREPDMEVSPMTQAYRNGRHA